MTPIRTEGEPDDPKSTEYRSFAVALAALVLIGTIAFLPVHAVAIEAVDGSSQLVGIQIRGALRRLQIRMPGEHTHHQITKIDVPHGTAEAECLIGQACIWIQDKPSVDIKEYESSV